VDATFVRMVLVPASMALLGRANWWASGSSRPPAAAHRWPRSRRGPAAQLQIDLTKRTQERA
jgi:hypothetical protein